MNDFVVIFFHKDNAQIPSRGDGSQLFLFAMKGMVFELRIKGIIFKTPNNLSDSLLLVRG
jgi:hypothetical protein